MWNKPQQEPDANPTPPQPEPAAAPAPKPAAPPERQAILGPSITIKGSLSGEEDLLIEGRVEGEISFKQHTVTVGKRGRVDADLTCKQIFVEGEVHGNLFGEDLVVVRKSANVKGNATAPRVSLEDGAQFHGSIDMKPKPAQPETRKQPNSPTATKPDIPETKVRMREAAVQK